MREREKKKLNKKYKFCFLSVIFVFVLKCEYSVTLKTIWGNLDFEIDLLAQNMISIFI